MILNIVLSSTNIPFKACSEPDDIKARYIDTDGTPVEVPEGGGGGYQAYVLSKTTGFSCENADQIPRADTGEKEECKDYQVQLCCKGIKELTMHIMTECPSCIHLLVAQYKSQYSLLHIIVL